MASEEATAAAEEYADRKVLRNGAKTVDVLSEIIDRHLADLRDEIKADDILLRGRKQLTDALDDISECRPHGRECVPHALDVIAELRKDKARLEALQNVKILATVMSMPTGMPTREAIDKAMEESDESDG